MTTPSKLLGVGVPSATAREICGTVERDMVATGTNQATAAQLSATVSLVSVVPANAGVRLVPSEEGATLYVVNQSSNTLPVYGRDSDTINDLAVGVAFVIAAGGNMQFSGVKKGEWITLGASAPVGNFIPTSEKGQPDGVAPLGSDGIVPGIYLPPNTGAVINDETITTTSVWSSSKTNTAIAASVPGVVTTSANGLMLATDKVKLDGVAANATQNQTDAFLLALANATGTLPQSQVTNLTTDLGTITSNISTLTTIVAAKLPLAGGTLTGFLTLNADPTAALHAATRQWVLAQIPGATARTILTTTAALVAGASYGLNTSGGAFTVTLPASPAAGARVPLMDARGTWGTNNATVARNGQPIMGLAQDLTLAVSNWSITLEYIDATYGWAIT